MARLPPKTPIFACEVNNSFKNILNIQKLFVYLQKLMLKSFKIWRKTIINQCHLRQQKI